MYMCEIIKKFILVVTFYLSLESEKPGNCPVVDKDTFGTCIHSCNSDYDCSSTHKCCSNGCGRVCTPSINKTGRYAPLIQQCRGDCINGLQICMIVI